MSKRREADRQGSKHSRKLPLPPSSAGTAVKSEGSVGRRTERTQLAVRRHVVSEIVKTEAAYTKDLDLIIQIYLEPLRSTSLLSQEEVEQVFSNIEDVWLANLSLQREFERQREDTKLHNLPIGEIFLKAAPKLAVYPEYCNNQKKAFDTVEELEQRPAFASFLEGAMNDVDSRNLRLLDFLVKPFQRICKYPLLLRELLKYTPESHKDRANLVRALTVMDNLAQDANSAKEVVDITRMVEGSEAAFKDAKGKHTKGPSDRTPGRRFVREGAVQVVSNGRKEERHVFLFNDSLLLTRKVKEKKYKLDHLVMLAEAQVRLEDDGKKQGIEFIHVGTNKVYQFYPSDRGGTDTWFAALDTYVKRCRESTKTGSAIAVGNVTSVSTGRGLQDRVMGVFGASQGGSGAASRKLLGPPPSAASAPSSALSGGSSRQDDRVAMAQHLEIMDRLQRKIDGLEPGFLLSNPKRRFIREGTLIKIAEGKHNERHFFLFTDILVYTEHSKKNGKDHYQFKKSIDLTKALVRNYEAQGPSQSVDSKVSFQIVRFDTKKVYTLKAASVAEKQAWFRDISECIDALLKKAVTERNTDSSYRKAAEEMAAAATPRSAGSKHGGGGGGADVEKLKKRLEKETAARKEAEAHARRVELQLRDTRQALIDARKALERYRSTLDADLSEVIAKLR